MPTLYITVQLYVQVRDSDRRVMTRWGMDHPVLHAWHFDLSWEVENPRGLTFNLWIVKEYNLLITIGSAARHSAEGGDLFINHFPQTTDRATQRVSSAGSSNEPAPDV